MDGGWGMKECLLDHHKKKEKKSRERMCFVFIRMHLMCLDFVSSTLTFVLRTIEFVPRHIGMCTSTIVLLTGITVSPL